jgi:hypothetical protein
MEEGEAGEIGGLLGTRMGEVAEGGEVGGGGEGESSSTSIGTTY